MLAKSKILLLALVAVLAVAGPASGKEKERPQDSVAVSASGVGIAPNAPDWVRERIAAIHAGRIEQAEIPEASGMTARAPQALRPASWIGCRSVYAWRGYNHLLGYNLFRYYQQVSWCSNGFGIYSYVRDRWPETHVGWRFNGHIGSSLSGGSTSRSAWTQGSFAFCVGGCFDHKYPWVLIDVNVNGGWNAYAGG